MRTIYTIGHSTRTEEEMISVLKDHSIEILVDVRGKWPYSKHNPQHNKENLERWVPAAGIKYMHLQLLGGWQPKQDVAAEVNGAWRRQGFHNYADYTLSLDYAFGIAELESLARYNRVAYMCAEIVPWRCHRLIISNTMSVRDWEVRHIINPNSAIIVHELGLWGAAPAVEPETLEITYPRLESRETIAGS